MTATEAPEKVPNGVREAFTKRRKRKLRPPLDRPPDKKRSPGSVGAEHGADRNSDIVRRQQSTKRPQGKQGPDRDLALYDGQIRVGNITVTGGEFIVVLPDGALLGSFKTLKQASAAISTAQGGVR